jgi:hypoxanthine phosphoribosyltransferase
MSIFAADNITPMLSKAEIDERVAVMGEQITRDYEGKELVLIGILKGSFVFLADLGRAVDLPLTVDFIGLSSYGDATQSSGVVRLTQDVSKPIEGKHVLVVEDIVDTGLTMRYLFENLQTRNPASIKLCSLLEKPSKNKSGIAIDYLGFSIPDKYVIGYGLDAAGKYRNLPFVGVMEGDG